MGGLEGWGSRLGMTVCSIVGIICMSAIISIIIVINIVIDIGRRWFVHGILLV